MTEAQMVTLSYLQKYEKITDVKYPAAPESDNLRVQYTSYVDTHSIEYMVLINTLGQEVGAPATRQL